MVKLTLDTKTLVKFLRWNIAGTVPSSLFPMWALKMCGCLWPIFLIGQFNHHWLCSSSGCSVGCQELVISFQQEKHYRINNGCLHCELTNRALTSDEPWIYHTWPLVCIMFFQSDHLPHERHLIPLPSLDKTGMERFTNGVRSGWLLD